MNESPHRWTFARIGGVDQVVLRSGEDIANLRDLDQKLWAVLTMPARQHLMRDTLEYLDADRDGRIRAPDILRTVDELQAALSSLDLLLEQSDRISTAQTADESLRQTIVKVHDVIAATSAAAVKGSSKEISVDLTGIDKAIGLFSMLPLNGDGVVVPESTENPDCGFS